MDTDLDVALDCARQAAAVVAAGFETVATTELKGTVDPVTEFDRAAEATVRSVLATRRPDDGILGEEEGGDDWRSGRVWIVDPLDGTVNFVHHIPQVSVSVALWEDGRPQVGVVHDAIRNEVFSARRGFGAHLDGAPIRVSPVDDTVRSLVVTGFPYDRRERAGELAEILGRVLAEVQGIRRLGSSALDLCWVAAGRFEAYWEYRLHPWDTAAGQLIVEEAGGRVTDLDGTPYRPGAPGLLASNDRIHQRLLEVIAG